jgi:hypothetical protein
MINARISTANQYVCINRLKYLLGKVERDDIRRDELKSSLEYVVAILDAVFFDDTRWENWSI